MTYKARNFAYENPIFGRSKEAQKATPYKNSVYYLWWEFLRRNDAYKKCCVNEGKGRLKNLYRDFGDVFAVDFKTWWRTNDRGAVLFAEQLPAEFKLIVDGDELINNDKLIYLQIPLALPKRELLKKFHELLDIHHEGRAGIRTNINSTAKYPITGHVDIEALKKCLRVYDMKKEHPKMKLWELAKECNIAFAKQTGAGITAMDSDTKLVFANTASRLLKKAKIIIAGTVEGKFPVLK